MRVLHVMESTIGGTRRHLVDVASAQRASGLDVHVVASCLRQPAFEDDLARLEREGVTVTRLALVRAIRPHVDARHLATLQRLLERARPDVVHTHSSKAGVLGRLASITTGVGARVHTPHTFAFLFHSMFGRTSRRLFEEIERALAADTRAVIAVSRGEGLTFARSGVVDPARVRVVPNGIDPTRWLAAPPYARSEFDIAEEQVLVAVVGLLNVAKGQDLLLEALARPGLAHVSLLVIGHGEDEASLRAQVERLRLTARVRFLGFRDDVPRLLATCDALCLPSRWEGMPYAVLEAFASAKPVVATPVDGARELLEDGACGVVSDAIDVESLARALRTVCAAGDEARTLRAALGARGRERLLRGHTVQAMVERLVAVYREVLAA